MAEQQNNNDQQLPSNDGAIGNTFEGGMWKDALDADQQQNTYYNALNGAVSLPDGQRGRALHTEAANRLSISKAPLILIGSEYMEGSQWVTFWTDNTISEVGIYDTITDTYTVLVNDAATIAGGKPGMGFKTTNLITCSIRRNYDCGFNIYWSDERLNPDRILDTQFLQPNPWFQDCTFVSPGCLSCVNTDQVDIEKLRLAPVFHVPCLTLAKSKQSGMMENGSYQVAVAYTANGQRCTDYIALSNIQSIWSHVGIGGALELHIEGAEQETFKEMEVVVIALNNLNTVARRLGLYSTRQSVIYIDHLNPELETVPLSDIPVSNPAIVSSDAIYSLSNYLTRVGPSMRPDVNYQPLANQIRAQWVCVEYPEDYYHKGGFEGYPMNVGYMRGEVYAFYIRGVYTTGDKTACYPMVCQPTGATFNAGGPSVGDGSTTIAHGFFDPYISTEIYPDDLPSVWNSNIPGHPEWDLCGQPIRWFKFPDQSSAFGTGSIPGAPGQPTLAHYHNYGTSLQPDCTIRIMGVYFDNIQPFVDINGNIIPDIQGYEILRATRDGNASIVAKGMINNMRIYTDMYGNQGIFQNYPYNDLSPDYFLTDNIANINQGTVGNGANSPLFGYHNDILSFHSPETVFQSPYLGLGHLDLIMGMRGNSRGQFVQPYKHPMFKVLSDFDSWLADLIAALEFLIDIVTGINMAAGGNPPDVLLSATNDIPITIPLFLDNQYTTDVAATDVSAAAKVLADITNIAIIGVLAPIKALIIREQFLTIIKGLIPGRQYAVQYNSSGFYAIPEAISGGSYKIKDYEYILGQMQTFAGYTVNNLYRNNYVAIQLDNIGITPLFGDNSRYNLGPTRNPDFGMNNTHTIESWYAAYRVPLLAQYGQIDSLKLVPISCMQSIIPVAGARYTSQIMFGGDIYINRYTEKNPFFFFNDWLVDAPEDIKYDYRNYINVPYPMFWINNDVVTYDLLGLAHKNRRLDGPMNIHLFYVTEGYFYLFNNGVRDFFVESTVNVGYRDWQEPIQNYFYDPYGFTDVNQMFRSDIIKTPIFYKYDYSLSANRFWNQWFTWGQCLRRDFNPSLAYTCFAYYPRRVYYSLAQDEETIHDNWRLFLPNNYADFPSRVRRIEGILQSGGMFLLEDDSPVFLPGVQSIPSTTGSSFSTGSGALFSQGLQTVSNAQKSLQYGSSISRFACVNTTHGVYWVSQRTGKIFRYAHGQSDEDGEVIHDIAKYGMKYWLSLYLPCKFIEQFPDFDLTDNPVAGVGTQLLYDNTIEIIYICKRDYIARYPSLTTYIKGHGFVFDTGYIDLKVDLSDPTYFIDCSWTLSFDPVKRRFVSFHSWKPKLSLSGDKHIITTDPTGKELWKHNEVADQFCNFYGTDYPFSVEMPLNSQMVTTIENIEYLMDSFIYRTNETDKFNEFGQGFDGAMIFNPEQSTLWTSLTLKPYNNPYGTLGYPFINASGNNALYTKVENKYRFTSIFDYTKDRGQFTLTTQQMKDTDPSGVVWSPVLAYFDYLKSPLQLKKIRHYNSRLVLQKSRVGNASMSLRQVRTNVKPSLR